MYKRIILTDASEIASNLSNTSFTGPVGCDVTQPAVRYTQGLLTSRTRSCCLRPCTPHRATEQACNKCLPGCALPLQPPEMNLGRGGTAKKEKGIDLCLAPCSQSEYTAAGYWLFQSPSIITFYSQCLSRSSTIIQP